MIIKGLSNKEVIIAFSSDDFIVYFDLFTDTYVLYNKDICIPLSIKTANKLKKLWWNCAWEFSNKDIVCE